MKKIEAIGSQAPELIPETETRKQTLKDKIYNYLIAVYNKNQKQLITSKDIAEAVNKKPKDISRIISGLVHQGNLDDLGKIVNGEYSPFTKYLIAIVPKKLETNINRPVANKTDGTQARSVASGKRSSSFGGGKNN